MNNLFSIVHKSYVIEVLKERFFTKNNCGPRAQLVFFSLSTFKIHTYFSLSKRRKWHLKYTESKPTYNISFQSSPNIIIFILQVGHDWGYFTMITDLPKYFSDVLKFNIKETGLMSALPYMAMYVCSFLFAYLCDLCIRKKWHSITTGRKIYTTVCKYSVFVKIFRDWRFPCQTRILFQIRVFAVVPQPSIQTSWCNKKV